MGKRWARRGACWRLFRIKLLLGAGGIRRAVRHRPPCPHRGSRDLVRQSTIGALSSALAIGVECASMCNIFFEDSVFCAYLCHRSWTNFRSGPEIEPLSSPPPPAPPFFRPCPPPLPLPPPIPMVLAHRAHLEKGLRRASRGGSFHGGVQLAVESRWKQGFVPHDHHPFFRVLRAVRLRHLPHARGHAPRCG